MLAATLGEMHCSHEVVKTPVVERSSPVAIFNRMEQMIMMILNFELNYELLEVLLSRTHNKYKTSDLVRFFSGIPEESNNKY